MIDKQKILMVDDRKENLVALRQVLIGVDAEFVEATTGNEALAAALNHKFAVAILDVQMPGMSGYELAEHLRGEGKTRMIPIVFLTAAYTDEQHMFKGYEAGGVDYITKPYSPAVLLGKLKIFLEIDRNRQELEMYRDHLETLVELRVKELNCLYSVSSLIAGTRKSISDTIEAALYLIPQGWQYPEITCVRIVFDGRAFASTNFKDTDWKQSFNIVVSGETVGTLEVCYLEERPTFYEGPFLKEEEDLIGDLARKLGGMIECKQGETALQETHDKIKRNLKGCIKIISGTIEMKGPYPPGHHRRVVALASAIAQEMQLTDFQVQGIELAAAVYDIGLINVPIEFLQDTDMLDGLKLAMYRGYPRTGHDTLKKIEFTWPIANIVLEHCECFDGSGFPQGLYREEIQIEARVLSVAAALEDLTSHRSCRSAYPISKALNKILSHSGSKYDPDVVTACLKLFNEKGYKLKE